MYTTIYENLTAPLRRHPWLITALNVVDKCCVIIIACIYAGIIIMLCGAGDHHALRVIAVPAASFILLSIARKIINAPRPYEVYPINPLIKRSLHGKSFPGRHVFSAAVIACSLYIPSPICATITFVLACILAIVRVLGGVHFPRDVIVGLIAGAVCGILGYVILPA